MSNNQYIKIRGAKEHNLKNIDVDFPRNKLIVVTGLSGSGKSSLVFDTLYAEGQRRYTESLSTYAKQFLSIGKKPDVESIEGISPAIAIDQKSTTRNPRSTVGTVTEIYDYLRLLFARVGDVHCYKCGEFLDKQTSSEMVDSIQKNFAGKKIMLNAQMSQNKRGFHEIIEIAKSEGFVRVMIDDIIYTLDQEIDIDTHQKHNISIVVDRIKVPENIDDDFRKRTADSIEIILRLTKGIVHIVNADDFSDVKILNENLHCAKCDISIPEIKPSSFSFNSPHGACDACHGLGVRLIPEEDLVIPNPYISIMNGALKPWNESEFHIKLILKLSEIEKFSLETPWDEMDDRIKNIILHGYGENTLDLGASWGNRKVKFEGIFEWILRKYRESESEHTRDNLQEYMNPHVCNECHGNRLKKEVMGIKIDNKNISEVTCMSINELIDFFDQIEEKII